MNIIFAGLLTVTATLAIIKRKVISEKIHDFVGSWAWFVGSVMADAFENRMNQIEEELEEQMNSMPDSDDTQERPN